MASSLSKLVHNLSEGIHNNKCSDCVANLDYIKITAKPMAEPSALGCSSLERKNEKLILECYNCKQRYKKKFNKELIKRFASTYRFVLMTFINSYYCYEKVFILTNIWTIGKDLMKLHCLVKNHFIAT